MALIVFNFCMCRFLKRCKIDVKERTYNEIVTWLNNSSFDNIDEKNELIDSFSDLLK